MNVIETAIRAGFSGSVAKMWESHFAKFSDLVIQSAMDELKTQADYSGSNRRAFYMDAIEVLRKFKDSV